MKTAWIGTGVMGASMAGHWLRAGHELHVFTRTPEKARSLLDSGARWYGTPAEAARDAEVVGVMVGYPKDVEEVVLGEDGVLQTMMPGSLLIDFTTSRPDLAVRIAEVAASKKVDTLDAPVSGGDIGARNATLSIMVGGAVSVFERAHPLLDLLGKTVVHQGGDGAGQHTKIVNQILVSTNMIGVCECLAYARKSGLDPETVLRSVGGGAAASWTLTNLYPRMLKEDFEPGFYVEHFVKDLGIALDACRRLELELPGLSMAHRMYQDLLEQGYGRKGTQALYLGYDP